METISWRKMRSVTWVTMKTTAASVQNSLPGSSAASNLGKCAGTWTSAPREWNPFSSSVPDARVARLLIIADFMHQSKSGPVLQSRLWV